MALFFHSLRPLSPGEKGSPTVSPVGEGPVPGDFWFGAWIGFIYIINITATLNIFRPCKRYSKGTKKSSAQPLLPEMMAGAHASRGHEHER